MAHGSRSPALLELAAGSSGFIILIPDANNCNSMSRRHSDICCLTSVVRPTCDIFCSEREGSGVLCCKSRSWSALVSSRVRSGLEVCVLELDSLQSHLLFVVFVQVVLH